LLFLLKFPVDTDIVNDFEKHAKEYAGAGFGCTAGAASSCGGALI
jgi:hypothetical protein